MAVLMKWLSRVLFALGSFAILLGLVAGVVNREVIDGNRFAEHVDNIRADGDVSRQVGTLLSDRLIAANPELVGLRPLVESAAAATVSSRALGPVIRTTITPLHDALVSDSNDQVILRLADLGAIVAAAVTTLAPKQSAPLPDNLALHLSAFGSQRASSDLVELAQTTTTMSWLLPLLGLLLVIVAALIRRRRIRDLLAAVGRSLLWVSVVMTLLLVIASIIADRLDRATLTGAIASATWNELNGSLWRSTVIVGIAGLILWLTQRADKVPDLSDLVVLARRHLSTSPTTVRGLLARGLGLAAFGILTVLHPVTVVSVVIVTIGALAVVTGAEDIVRGIAAARRMRAKPPRIQWSPAATQTAAAATVILLLAGAATAAAWPATSKLPIVEASQLGTACNGHDELCERTYDQVSFAATHNSMSAGDAPGWFLAEQPTGMIGQLEAGVRVFLIDTWYGQRTQRQDIVATSESGRAAALIEAEETYGKAVVESALRLRDALSLTPTGPVGAYMCHALCELGSTEFEPELKRVQAWMTAHPREVVTFIVQDEVTPADTAKAIENAGLMPFIHTQKKGTPWPTLESMIDSGKRLVVLMENVGGGEKLPWLLDNDTWVQDTPFSFRSAQQFSCEEFRGEQDAPLFLVNHWLSNYRTRVADATVVNAKDVLLTRLEKCQQERGMRPNFVAVDNFDRGDLFGSVDALNGLS